MLDIVEKADIIIHAVVTTTNQCSGIEEVITSTIGNRVAAETARGFESLLLRQPGIERFRVFLFLCKVRLIRFAGNIYSLNKRLQNGYNLTVTNTRSDYQ